MSMKVCHNIYHFLMFNFLARKCSKKFGCWVQELGKLYKKSTPGYNTRVEDLWLLQGQFFALISFWSIPKFPRSIVHLLGKCLRPIHPYGFAPFWNKSFILLKINYLQFDNIIKWFYHIVLISISGANDNNNWND